MKKRRIFPWAGEVAGIFFGGGEAKRRASSLGALIFTGSFAMISALGLSPGGLWGGGARSSAANAD